MSHFELLENATGSGMLEISKLLVAPAGFPQSTMSGAEKISSQSAQLLFSLGLHPQEQ